MKIKISVEDRTALPGFINLSPVVQPNEPKILKCNLDGLNEYVDDGECEEIQVIDAFDYVPLPEKERVLNGWLSKLEHQGIITLVGNDLNLSCELSLSNILDNSKLREVLYKGKTDLFTMDEICSLLIQRGLSVNKTRYDGFKYVIEAQRP